MANEFTHVIDVRITTVNKKGCFRAVDSGVKLTSKTEALDPNSKVLLSILTHFFKGQINGDILMIEITNQKLCNS